MFWGPSLLVKYILFKGKLSFVLRLISFFIISKCSVLFEVIFLLKLISLLSKPVFLTKLTCDNLSANFSVVNLLNSWDVINLTWSGFLFSTLLILVLRTVVVSKLLVSGILFSTSLIFVFLPSPMFSLNFVYLYRIDLCKLK